MWGLCTIESLQNRLVQLETMGFQLDMWRDGKRKSVQVIRKKIVQAENGMIARLNLLHRYHRSWDVEQATVARILTRHHTDDRDQESVNDRRNGQLKRGMKRHEEARTQWWKLVPGNVPKPIWTDHVEYQKTNISQMQVKCSKQDCCKNWPWWVAGVGRKVWSKRGWRGLKM